MIGRHIEPVSIYGKTSLLKRIFGSRRGWITLPVDISLEGLDTNEEEL